MKKSVLFSLVVAGSIALSSALFAGTMDISGKVTAVTNDMITVQSDTGTWNVTRAAGVKVTGELKVGSTVTVHCNETDAQKRETPTND